MRHKKPRQFAVRTGSLRKIMSSSAFVAGAHDGRIGAPWPKSLDIHWDYERGRLFGVMHPDVPVKAGRAVSEKAYRLAALAVIEKAII